MRKPRNGRPDARSLRSLLAYDPHTGVVTRLVTTSSRGLAGKVFGWTHRKDGGDYLLGSVDGQQIYVHIVIWAMVTGEWPPDGMVIDHRDGNGLNNRWSNLRLATHSQNLANSRLRHGKTSGLPKGVSPAEPGVYLVQLVVDGRRVCSQRCRAVEEAAALYEREARRYFGEFARLE